MSRKIIYIDMDGVIANFKKAADEGGWKHRPDKHVDYRNLEVMPWATDALITPDACCDVANFLAIFSTRGINKVTNVSLSYNE